MIGKRLPKPKTHDEWLEQRRQGITGTDIAGLMGISNYKSPMSIYLDKVSPPPPAEASIPMRLGNALEDPIAKFWSEENPGHTLRNINTTIVHPDMDWARCNIDRHIVSPEESLLECKLVGMGKTGEWRDDGLPDEYYVQIMWQMVVTGLRKVHVAAIVGGTKYEQRVVEYDQAVAGNLIELAYDFWSKHVVNNIPPAIDGSQATTDAITRMYCNDNSEAARDAAIRFLGSGYINLPHEADNLIRQYAEMNDAINTLSKTKDSLVDNFVEQYEALETKLLSLVGEKNSIANEMRMMVGLFEEATSDLGNKVTWKTQERKVVDTKKLKEDMGEAFYDHYTKVSKSRVLRISRPKTK